ncbi:hypothetical protein ETB97_003592 [Aspergillus alliaceus]|uniref:Uncharacterized protein n=1 Tax=Petromyces alliaceus TaxID=209559 RepID=A0A8H6E481_PETAA|nr:hypothetical protein ETB97_003592 [Aspergillus burnettii]
MRIIFGTTLLGTAYALPSIHSLHQAIPNATWGFSLYQNNHCTGEITLFSGIRGTPCRNAILNGGALSYVPDKITSSHCKVHLFNDGHCSGNRTLTLLMWSKASVEQFCRSQSVSENAGTFYCVVQSPKDVDNLSDKGLHKWSIYDISSSNNEGG